MINAHALRTGALEMAGYIAPIEKTLDDSLALQAKLLACAPETRLKANLPASAGHQAIVRIAAAIQATIDARSAFLDAHKELADMRDELRIPETDFGSLDGCPKGAQALSVVSRAA